MSDPNLRWLVVRNGETRVVSRYLYAGATVIDIVEDEETDTPHPVHLVLIRTPRDNVQFVADYQADRLRSGLMGVTVHDNYMEAVAALPK